MSVKPNPRMPSVPFGFLLVEGGDERAVCEAVAGPTIWPNICCWNAGGQGRLQSQAMLALRDSNFANARSVGLVLDVEDDLAAAMKVAGDTLAIFGHSTPVVHAALAGSPLLLGAFLVPDGASHGSIETLCRQAVRDRKLALCVDQLVQCAGIPHRGLLNARAKEDKGWIKAYLAMLPDPDLRFHQSFSTGLDPNSTVFNALRNFIQSL